MKKNKNQFPEKLNTMKVVFPISLEELATEVTPKGEIKTWDIVKILDEKSFSAEDKIINMLKEIRKNEGWDVKIKSVNFDYYDSPNITHGVAYFNVTLEGTEKVLERILKSEIFLPLEEDAVKS